MRFFKCLISLLITVVFFSCNNEVEVKHVVLISLDGSRPEFYMDRAWPAPYLQKMRSEGIYASQGVTSVFPSVTYPAHTSMVTGAYPIHHGIYYNSPFEGRPGEWYWNENMIKSKTLWDAVKEAGMTSAAVFWPVTVDGPIDYNFPVRRPEKNEDGDQLDVTIPYMTPKDLLTDIEEEKGIIFTANDLTAEDYAQSKTIATISNHIIEKYKPNLMAIHFVGIDHVQHAVGTDDPKVKKMVHVTDSLIGTVLQTIREAGIEKSTAVIITGDHGHTNTKATFAPNIYLANQKLIKNEDWRARFKGAGGSAFLHLKNNSGRGLADSVVAILESTDEYKAGYFSILDRKVLDEMGANPEVSLGISMKKGLNVSNRIKGATFTKHNPPYKSGHGYDPEYPSMHTAFIAAGAGIGTNKDIQGMGLVDIAPLIAGLLGVEYNAPDGKLYREVTIEK